MLTERTMSKGEFAELIGVSAGRISQYLTSGIIGADALVGDGRYARIRVNLAIEQVRARRDPGQATGLNGIRTRLDRVPDKEMVTRGNHSSSIVESVISRHEALPERDDADEAATRAILDRIESGFREIYREVWGALICGYPQATDAEVDAIIVLVFEKQLRQAAAALATEYAEWVDERDRSGRGHR